MSMYNVLFGTNPIADMLLTALGLTSDDVPRFRDCYLSNEDDKPRIAIYTRTGGGNRDFYEHEELCRRNYPEYFSGTDDPSGPWNSDLRTNPHFLYDEDDDFDCTYATFYFVVPEPFGAVVSTLQEIGSGAIEKPADRFQRLLSDLSDREETDDTRRAIAALTPVVEALSKVARQEPRP